MNDQGSQDYTSFMNAKYPTPAESPLQSSAPESQMTSQFGKKFIKEKQAQQNERKTFKINTQIKRDSNTEASNSTLSACQSQMQ